MNFSIVIPTLNRPGDLRRTLESILGQSLLPEEIIIIDQSDNEETRELVDTFQRRGKVELSYERSSRKSLTAARNVGLDCATAEITTMLDDDVALETDYLAAIGRVFKERDAILVGGKITNVRPRSSVHFLVELFNKVFFLCREEANKFDVQASFNPTQCFGFEHLINAQWVSGSNHSVLSAVAREVRYDEQLTRYGHQEDVDFSYRVYKRYPDRVLVTPKARLKHYVSPTSRLPNRTNLYMEAIHRRYLFKKNIQQSIKNKAVFYWSRLGRILLLFALLFWKGQLRERVSMGIDGVAAEIYALKNRKYIDKGNLAFFHKWLGEQ